jgi:uncharacterized cupredoxin-like copper-binding protein
MVSTIKYKQAEIDLKKSMEVTFESQGAQNMIVKQEDFETEEGQRFKIIRDVFEIQH